MNSYLFSIEDFIERFLFWNLGSVKGVDADYLVMKYEHSSDVKMHMAMIVFLPRKNSPTAVDEMLDGFTDLTVLDVLKNVEEDRFPGTVDVEFPKLSEESTFSLDGVCIQKLFFFYTFSFKD